MQYPVMRLTLTCILFLSGISVWAVEPVDKVAMLIRYAVSAGHYNEAEALAQQAYYKQPNPANEALLEQVRHQRNLALQIALASAQRAQDKRDWATLRKETARALAIDLRNPQALAFASWMAERGIVRGWQVGDNQRQ